MDLKGLGIALVTTQALRPPEYWPSSTEWASWWVTVTLFLLPHHGPLRVLATNRAKEIIGNMQMLVGKVMLWQESTSQKVVGSNPGAGKGHF